MANCVKAVLAYDRRMQNEYQYRLSRIGQFVNSSYDDEMSNVLRFTTHYVAEQIEHQYTVALNKCATYIYAPDLVDSRVMVVHNATGEHALNLDTWRCDCEFSMTMSLPCRHAIAYRKHHHVAGPVIPWTRIDERAGNDLSSEIVSTTLRREANILIGQNDTSHNTGDISKSRFFGLFAAVTDMDTDVINVEASQQPDSEQVAVTKAEDANAIRDACIAQETRKKYTGSINGIKKWIKSELAKTDHDTARFFDTAGEINLAKFTPESFDKFLMYKIKSTKSAILSGYRSAIKDLYRLTRIALPVEYGAEMKQLFSGFKRREAEQNQSSSPKTSGKQPLTYSLYTELCKSTLLRSDSGFSHLFLTSQWNLMYRSVSVQTLQTHHLLAKDDSAGAIFFKTKTNQEGTGPRDPRHLFANPFSPSTCWVTALGIYLACNARLQPGALFPGSDPKIRFGKMLSSLLQKKGTAKIYGTHSVRKGVATFACGGSTGGPSIVSVCLRCGWSIGGVQDRYFRYEAAGDRFFCRVVAGLPVNNSDFAALPPHFRDDADTALKSCIAAMFPGLASEINLRGILRLCLVSLVYHAEYLTNTLPPKHPLLSTLLFAEPTILVDLRSKLEVSETSWMKSSGIPPHIELYKKLDKQQQSIDALPSMLEKHIENVPERKGVASGNITQELLRSEIKSLLEDVGLHRSNATEPAAISSSPVRTYYSWGGKFHRLPKHFEFPSIDPLGAWRLWWFGDTRRDYPPFKGILSDDLDTQKKKATLSEWSMMMRHIINAIEEQTHQTLPEMRDEAHAIKLFNFGYSMLRFKPSKRKRRLTQIKLTTALRLIREADGSGTRSFPFKPRKRQAASSSLSSNTLTATALDPDAVGDASNDTAPGDPASIPIITTRSS